MLQKTIIQERQVIPTYHMNWNSYLEKNSDFKLLLKTIAFPDAIFKQRAMWDESTNLCSIKKEVSSNVIVNFS